MDSERLLIGLPAELSMLLENQCLFWKDDGHGIFNGVGKFVQLG